MSVTMEKVLAVLDTEEPDYDKARKLGSGALPFLRQLVQGADQMLACKAASAAGEIDGPGAVAVLEQAARSPVAAVRVNAAAAVSQLKKPLGSTVLMPLLSDPDPGVRRRALRSSVGRLNPVLRTRIHQISISDHHIRLREEAAGVLKNTSNSPSSDTSAG